MKKWKVVYRSDAGAAEWVALENLQDPHDVRIVETVFGKKSRFERELKSGCREASPLFDHRYKEHDGRVLTSGQKAYREGWLACYRENKRICDKKKKR